MWWIEESIWSVHAPAINRAEWVCLINRSIHPIPSHTNAGAATLEDEGVTGLEAIKGKIERLNLPGVVVNFVSVDVQSSIDGASVLPCRVRRAAGVVGLVAHPFITFRPLNEQAACSSW